MTEQQIRESYERLDSTLRPPPDAPARVQQAVSARRRRRRITATGAGALAVTALAGALVVVMSGDNGTERQVAVDPPPGVTSTLKLTRPDGSTYTFPDVKVSCEPPQSPAGDPVSSGSGRIWLYSPILFEGDVAGQDDEDEIRLEQPFVLFEGRLDKLQGDRTFTLPVDGPGGSDTHPLILFAADTQPGPDGNEVVSSGNSSGTVRVLRASCEPTPVLELEVDATLGSEEGKQSLDLAGSVG